LSSNPGVVNPVLINTPASKDRAAPEIVKPEVDAEVLTSVDTSTLNDSFVYVHCYFRNKWENMLIRIWKTTFLIDEFSGTRSSLLHAENISMAPRWTQIPDGLEYSFLLIFSGLPKTCKQFDLVEEISEPGGFFVRNISRNETDVYHINISS
jgi:hypothetical protein